MASSLTRRENRRSFTLFAALVLVLGLLLFYNASFEQLVWSLALLTSAVFFRYSFASTHADRLEEAADREPEPTRSRLLRLALIVFFAVALAAGIYLFRSFSAGLPEVLARLADGVMGGFAVGYLIHLVSGYTGSFWLSREERAETGRSLKVAAAAVFALLLALIGAYVLIEYVAAPLIRTLA
ncbi:Hypothetical Protein RradSPS_0451 [Rubrobacter radiotolerans]|uniref:Uncharacterized protein n=1 Tax=Rubrobacter radiotolerans TaxID=42256 RepID=A0A023X0Z2_RUBRA|nr:hypothetical protein [Rubrobacter radiotolerans]AHY45734.1 Hypothetical Protein RradSPS_0451 [Rubrobacter radiotolerans]MDX5893150.1 hypothetical protein [Rubrobacter radiotolerans]SMC03159.1 hypothetical protein SAMN00767673_0453 [Rubrobacter radiotolerans DSM 5868]